ncbi:MAG: PQQ-like beta-propeller repeat protein [Pirellulales bacterium]|nr:PQQ-like beta-propeller repeat protein [Pirellulales bacterium]
MTAKTIKAPFLSSLTITVIALLGCSNESPTKETAAIPTPRQEETTGPSAPQSNKPSDTLLADASDPDRAQPQPSGGSAAGDCFWPRFHGPDGRNLSSDAGLMKQWPEGGPPTAWKTQGIGMGYASITIADGRIYTDGNIGDKTVVTALDMDGRIIWQTETGPAWTKSYEGTRGTPTFDTGRVYHESPLGDVVCLDAKTGKKVWGLNILDEFGGKNIQWALAESVLIDGDRLICCPGGPDASVVALDKQTGKTVWKAKSTGDVASYGSPALAECQGIRIIMTMNAKAMIGVNADTGDLLWRHDHETQYDVNAMMPLYHDGHVFISTGYGSGSELLRIQVDGKKAAVEQVWQSKDLDNQHGGVVLVDGFLYGAAHNSKKWICLDWKTGKQMFAERGVGMGSLTYADGMLYTMSERRDIGLVAATPAAHQVISEFKLPSGGEGPTWAHPVVCGGRLYIRHGDWLYTYDVRAEK